MNETVKPTRSGVSLRNLVGYGLGEVGCQLSWYMINSYLNIFYTDIVGITPTLFKAQLQDWTSMVLIDQKGKVLSKVTR